MDIITFLKEDSNNARLSMEDKWLVWWEDQWLVLQRPYGKKTNRTLYAGDNIEEALQALRGEA